MAATPIKNFFQIVIPIFNEEDNLPELTQRLEAIFDQHNQYKWEAILVDDGSSDGSVAYIQETQMRDMRFRLVQLSRNFGHQPAITAGISLCHADAIIIMDGDLQDPPEIIPQLIEKWIEGSEVVRATRISRSETKIRGLGFSLFHKFFNAFSDYPIPANSGVFSLLDKKVAKAYNTIEERHRFFPGISAWLGFQQSEVLYHRDARSKGAPKQTFRKLVSYALDALFSFSYVPLRLLSYSGVIISFSGFGVGLFFALRRILGYEIAFTGFTTLVTLLLLIGGFQLIALGIIGEYLARIYDEAKNRPYFIIKK